MKSEERFTRREKGKGKKNVLNSSLVLAMVVLLLLMVFVLLATPAAAQPVKVWVNAPEYVEEGATFVVTIDVDSITDFNTGMFDLSFNSSMVIVTDVEDGRLDDETIPVELWRFMDEDTIKVFLEIPGVSVVSGSGYLAKISFLAGGEKGDESVLDLSNGELVKYVFEYDRVTPEEISAEWIDTEVRIVKGEPIPTPTPPGDRVHNLNTSKNFSSIQAAIDDPDTKEGHVIEVEDGFYYENVDVTKALTIRSENGSASCIVQAAKANDNVFEITADHVCIRGVTVKDVFAGGKAGINLNASYCNVSNNNCSNNYCGILLEGSCNNIVSDNNCFLNNEDGILLSGSSNNTLSGNSCSSNNWRGIYLRNSRDNTLFNNNCFSNTDYGIILYESSGNRIYLNNFINTKNVYSHGVINIWNSDKKMTYTYNGTSYTNYLGNYWSDYTGEDTDGDGIGDSPYHRDIDNYPLMMPFENYLVSKQIYVPDDYPTIQQAVDNATEGNIIIVRDGAYVENVKVNKRLTIRSENGTDSTIVIAEDSYKNVFEVTADCVNINGFSMEGAKGEAKAGIYLNADHCYISNNNASNCSVGIFLLFADDNTITGNRATGNEKDGIYLNNSYKNELEGNKLLNNTHGIHFYNHSKNNIVSENEVSNNYEGIKFIESSNNWIYLNNFIENVYNARSVASNNTWNSTLKMIYTHNNCVYKNYMGNYWSDYIGTDVDKDGIGDAPYRIKSDEDRYPLMRSWQDYYIISNPIYVPDDYPTIQQAVNNATEGDVIIVRDGTYVENIKVNAKKRLAIWSENGSEATIIQPADSNDHVFEITADYVRISGFMVKGATGTKAGIYLKASYCNISNNNVTNNEYGIYMDYSSNNTLTNNTMSGNTRNIAVYGSNLLHFFHNIDTSNTVDGKSIYYWVNQQNQQIPGDAGFVALVNCTNITVRDLVLRNNSAGVLLASANNSRIENVSASNNGNGIRLIYSSCNNIISNNNCSSNNGCGIRLFDSSKNILTNNTVKSNNFVGIWLSSSSNNTLTKNTMMGNKCNFAIRGDSLSHFVQNIDTSNEVNEKPIYYWVNKENQQIPSDAGYAGIVNCMNITVRNLTLTNNWQGVLLAYSSNSRVEYVNASNNLFHGIKLVNSSNNTISNSTGGISLWDSSNNTVSNNVLNNHREDIYLWSSNSNTIKSNNCDCIKLWDSSNNTVLDNEFHGYGNGYGTGIILSGDNNTVEDNICEDFPTAIYIEGSNNTISENLMLNCTYGIRAHTLYCNSNNRIINNTCEAIYGFYLDHAPNTTISGNRIKSENECIYLRGPNSTISNNIMAGRGLFMSYYDEREAYGNVLNGEPLVFLKDAKDEVINRGAQVFVSNCKNVTVRNINFKDVAVGVYLRKSSQCIVEDNVCEGCSHGIYLGNSSENIVRDNICNNCTQAKGPLFLDGDGIHIEHSADNNVIENNTCCWNEDEGIDVWKSSNNTIKRNEICENKDGGVDLISSSNNKMYLNNFVNNAGSASIGSGSNIWNSTSKLNYTYKGRNCTNYLGNYWSDYKGHDEGGDGIGDTPYHSGRDNYPLMERVENYFVQKENIFDYDWIPAIRLE